MQDKVAIALGQRVEMELISKSKKREKLQVVVVADAAADFDKGFLGISTPLAQAILGHTAGETLEYTRGDIAQVKILAVQPSENAPAADAAEQRDEALRRARDKAELANMVSFALTFDSKWGDYDPETIVENFEKKDDA